MALSLCEGVNGCVPTATTCGGRAPGECLRQLTQSIQRVDVWRLGISSERFDVEANPVKCGKSRLREVIVVDVKGKRVAYKVDGIGAKAESAEKLLHRHTGEIIACREKEKIIERDPKKMCVGGKDYSDLCESWDC